MRRPDGASAREFMVTARFGEKDRKLLDAGREARGVRNNSEYLRRLVSEDNARLARRRPKGNG